MKGNVVKNTISLAVLALFFPNLAMTQEIADTIYSGGRILTINDSAPTAEAVAVKGGRIIAVGALANVAPRSKTLVASLLCLSPVTPIDTT
jgi:hypothetical protein